MPRHSKKKAVPDARAIAKALTPRLRRAKRAAPSSPAKKAGLRAKPKARVSRAQVNAAQMSERAERMKMGRASKAKKRAAKAKAKARVAKKIRVSSKLGGSIRRGGY